MANLVSPSSFYLANVYSDTKELLLTYEVSNPAFAIKSLDVRILKMTPEVLAPFRAKAAEIVVSKYTPKSLLSTKCKITTVARFTLKKRDIALA